MTVVVRLILLAGLAAVVALWMRDRIATRVARAIVEPTRALAAHVPTIEPRTVATTIALPPPAPEPSYVPIEPKPIIKAKAKQPRASASGPFKVTRKEVEDAIANRMKGANAVVVKDTEGHPLGLKLTGVSMFGVQDGDVLTSANGYPLRTADESATALGALKDAKKVTFVLRRGEKSYAVPLELAD